MTDFYYRKLDVYKLAKDLTKLVYSLVRQFPDFEKYALCDQLRRAAVSIPSNIAEGTGRFSIKDRIHFLDISYGSLSETLCQMEIARELNYITQEEFEQVDLLASRVSMTLYGLKSSLVNKLNQQSNEPTTYE